MDWRGGEGRAGQGRMPDCLGGLSRVGISSCSTRPWNGQPPSYYYATTSCVSCVHKHAFDRPNLGSTHILATYIARVMNEFYIVGMTTETYLYPIFVFILRLKVIS